jgi:hypothetical protein
MNARALCALAFTTILCPLRAVMVGDFPGVDALIDAADAIVILSIDAHVAPAEDATLYTTHDCDIQRVLKGDIRPGANMRLRLMDTDRWGLGVATAFPLGSTHLMFLVKERGERALAPYRTLPIRGANVRLPDIGAETRAQAETVAETVRSLLRRAAEYNDRTRKRERAALEHMISAVRAMTLGPTADGLQEVRVVESGAPPRIAYELYDVRTEQVVQRLSSNYQTEDADRDSAWKRATGTEFSCSPDGRYLAIEENAKEPLDRDGRVLIVEIREKTRPIPFPEEELLSRSALLWKRHRTRRGKGWLSANELSLAIAGSVAPDAPADGPRRERQVVIDFVLRIDGGRATIQSVGEPQYDRIW